MPVSATPRISMRSPRPRPRTVARARDARAQRSRVGRAGDSRRAGRAPVHEVSRGRFAIRTSAGRWLDGRSIVETDEGPLTVLHTPGHAPDHLTFWHADSRTLFVGDMLVQGSTVVIPASHGGSLARVSAIARAHAAAQSRARVAGARPGDRRSGGADSPATSSIARSAKRRCSARIGAGGFDRRGDHREDLSRRSSTRWCRWRARACSRTCRSSKARAASVATATAGSSSS